MKFPSRMIGVALIGLSLSGCLGYDGEVQHGYALDPNMTSQVHVGEPAQQVLLEMGTPSTTSTIGGGAWYYFSQKTDRPVAFMKPKIIDQRIFAVYFDKNKKVVRIANYGLKDGRVFDFVSRTTPTGGKEENFLRSAFANLLRF